MGCAIALLASIDSDDFQGACAMIRLVVVWYAAGTSEQKTLPNVVLGYFIGVLLEWPQKTNASIYYIYIFLSS